MACILLLQTIKLIIITIVVQKLQLLDYDTFTYTYILGDNASKQAVIIDPVLQRVERDAKLLKELNFDLKYASNSVLK